MSDVIRDASLVRCPSCAGSGLVPRHTQQELDRLHAENAKLTDTINKLRWAIKGMADSCRANADDILAKTAKEGE